MASTFNVQLFNSKNNNIKAVHQKHPYSMGVLHVTSVSLKMCSVSLGNITPVNSVITQNPRVK